MGNSITLLSYISNNNIKPISKILELEGWSIININNNYVYYNKFKNIIVSDYPMSISDYNDIYDFYKTELLGPNDTIHILNELINNNITLLEEDIHKVNTLIKNIESENDLTNYSTLCFTYN